MWKNSRHPTGGLRRQLGLPGLAATGICSMLGASVYVVPFMIQRNVPGIGSWVLPAFLFAAIPALLAAMAYAILASAMPRAGGSYLYASRGLHPYLGFVASFSQWFGLSIVIGVIAYIIVPFLRDIAAALQWGEVAAVLETGVVRVGLALLLVWLFVGINVLGGRFYERTLIPLMFLMFGLGAIVIFAGFYYDQPDFAAALLERENRSVPIGGTSPFDMKTFLAAAAILFSSFIGFDSIAQAGGEARNPGRTLPLAIGIAVATVGTFYFLFTAAVYHAVPWSYIAQEAMQRDITAPGLFGYLLPGGWAVAIVAGAAIALINDLPAMLLAVSRLMFAWAEDGIFPRWIAPRTPSSPYAANGYCAKRRHGQYRHPGKPFRRRLLFRYRYHGDLHARQLPVHVPDGLKPAPAQSHAGLRGQSADLAALAGDAGGLRRGNAHGLSHHPYFQGPECERRSMVLSLHAGLAHRHGNRYRDIFPGVK